MRTLPAGLFREPHLIQWERILRWRKRTITLDDHADPMDGLDFFLALFANVFQMQDWLAKSRRDLSAEVYALFTQSANLLLVRDLTNGTKHMETTSYKVDGAATVAREYAGDGEYRYVVPRPGGRNVDAGVLADACIRELRGFMKEKGLLPAQR
jgi:hypothetical protein